MASHFLLVILSEMIPMKNIKFVMRVNRGGTHAPGYVQRIDRSPVQMTLNRKLALVMGKFTAEDAIKSLQNSRRIPELVPIEADTETLRV